MSPKRELPPRSSLSYAERLAARRFRSLAVEWLEFRTLLTAAPELVADINAVAASYSVGTALAAGGGLAYFGGNDGANGVQFWRTDGTTAGTQKLGDFRPTFDGKP